MNDITLLRDAGPEAQALTSAARSAARAALLAEIDGPTRRRRMPGRKVSLRLGAAGLAVAAAAWAMAVAVAPSDAAGPPAISTAPSPTQEPAIRPAPPGVLDANGIRLVAAEDASFPLSLDPVPDGLTPTFTRGGGPLPFRDTPVTYGAEYRSPDGDGFWFWTSHEDPREEWAFEHELPQWTYANADVTETGSVDVHGVAADMVRGDYDRPQCAPEASTPLQTQVPSEVCTSSFADLFWERPDGQWIWLRGEDAYSSTSSIVAVAESIVDRPQPVGLQFGLAPDGWSTASYDETYVSLANDADPDQRLSLGLVERWRGYETVDDVLDGFELLNAVVPTTLNGRPARMALTEGQPWPYDWWTLAGELPDGTLFQLQAPGHLTQEQVMAIAEQVTYTP